MPNHLLSKIRHFFVLLLITSSLLSCSNGDSLFTEITNDLPEGESVNGENLDELTEDNRQAESNPDEEAGVDSPLPTFMSVSKTVTGGDPAVAGIVFSADFEVEFPADMPLYARLPAALDQTKALEIAAMFGMGDQQLFNQGDPTSFYTFKAGNQLQMLPGHIQLINEAALLEERQTPFSADEVVAHTQNILETWEWPDFEIEIVPRSSNTAEIRRVINGEAVNFADMFIQINGNGQLVSASLFLPEFSPAERVQIISAENALEKLAFPSFNESGIQYDFGMNQVPEFQVVEPTPPTHWRNRYPAGSKVNLTGSISAFTSVTDPDKTALFLDRLRLTGATDMLQSLQQHGPGLVTVSGTVSADGHALQVDLWSAADLNNADAAAPLTGVIRLENGQAFLDNSRLGDGYLLVNPPSTLQAGSEVVVYQNFYFSNESGRFIEWNLIELNDRSVSQPQPVSPLTLSEVSTITIEKMVVAYGRPAAGLDPSVVYAPVWRIYGVTDTGLSVVFNIPAIE